MVNFDLLLALTGHEFTPGQPEKVLLPFPARLGGLAIPVVSKIAEEEHSGSLRVTEPVVNSMFNSRVHGNAALQQECTQCAVAESRVLARHERAHRQIANAEAAKSLEDKISAEQKFLMSVAAEKGISSWLTADPSPKYGTVLNKSNFRDAVCLRYGFKLDGLTTQCVCSADKTVGHALRCSSGGYQIVRHNEVRDVIAATMQDVFHDVEVEP